MSEPDASTPVRVPSLIHQDSGFLVVDKPAGWATQTPPGKPSVESFFRDALPDVASYLTAVHRLDRVTQGLVLLATNRKTARLLSDQFASGKVRKTYHATVEGKWCADQPQGTDAWVDWIRKIPDQAQVEIVPAESDGGRRSETLVTVLESNELSTTRLEMQPLTGRMHQLRVSSAHRGHPIAGDRLYGAQTTLPGSSDHDSIALQAHAIDFHHPKTGKRIRFCRSDCENASNL